MTKKILFPLLMLALLVFFSGCSRSVQREKIPPLKKGALRHEKEKKPAPSSIPKMKPAPLIMIDPGHGGKDQGTQSVEFSKYLEKNLTLATAQMLNSYLQEFGYKTQMTRKEDVFVSLKDRVDVSNQKSPDLFVSVHYNAAESTKAQGIEVYYYEAREDRERNCQSKLLANAVLEHVIAHTKAKSRGVKHGNYAVIRETKMPAILIEAGFMTNPEEMQKIKDVSYMKKIALGIALGIKQHIHNNVLSH